MLSNAHSGSLVTALSSKEMKKTELRLECQGGIHCGLNSLNVTAIVTVAFSRTTLTRCNASDFCDLMGQTVPNAITDVEMQTTLLESDTTPRPSDKTDPAHQEALEFIDQILSHRKLKNLCLAADRDKIACKDEKIFGKIDGATYRI